MKIAIIGCAQTKFKEHWDKNLRDLIREAGHAAIKNANIEVKDVDSLICANALSSAINDQSQVSSLCFDELGIKSSALISCGDASGASAINHAIMEINSGKSDVVMVLGVEKMTDVLSAKIVSATSQLLDQESESYNGATLPSIYALIARSYMEKFNIKEKHIAEISVKSHKNGMNNEYAQFRFEVTAEAVLKSPVIADPIRMLNNSVLCDGAAAIILCKEDIAKKYAKEPVFVIASGTGNDFLALHDRESLIELKATKLAAQEAYSQAKIEPSQIDLAEVHDATSISEVLAVEDLGFCKKGKGVEFIKQRKDSDGNYSINPSGGLKVCGHPLAATGIRQAIEICNQLRTKKAKLGLTHSLSGSGSLAIVNIFSR